MGMDIQTIIEAVSTIGFPIVMTGLLFWYITIKDKQHNAEINSLKDSIDQNTSILSELKGLITYLVGGKE